MMTQGLLQLLGNTPGGASLLSQLGASGGAPTDGASAFNSILQSIANQPANFAPLDISALAELRQSFLLQLQNASLGTNAGSAEELAQNSALLTKLDSALKQALQNGIAAAQEENNAALEEDLAALLDKDGSSEGALTPVFAPVPSQATTTADGTDANGDAAAFASFSLLSNSTLADVCQAINSQVTAPGTTPPTLSPSSVPAAAVATPMPQAGMATALADDAGAVEFFQTPAFAAMLSAANADAASTQSGVSATALAASMVKTQAKPVVTTAAKLPAANVFAQNVAADSVMNAANIQTVAAAVVPNATGKAQNNFTQASSADVMEQGGHAKNPALLSTLIANASGATAQPLFVPPVTTADATLKTNTSFMPAGEGVQAMAKGPQQDRAFTMMRSELEGLSSRFSLMKQGIAVNSADSTLNSTGAEGFSHLMTGNRGAVEEALNKAQAMQNTVRDAAAFASPAEQVKVHIQQALQNGQDRITLKLQPEELGRVDIRMDIRQDGNAQLMVTADKQETLDALQRDARDLTRALQQAGIRADSGSLQFSLRGDGGNAYQFAGNNGKGKGTANDDDDMGISGVSAAAVRSYTYGAMYSDRVDIQV